MRDYVKITSAFQVGHIFGTNVCINFGYTSLSRDCLIKFLSLISFRIRENDPKTVSNVIGWKIIR